MTILDLPPAARPAGADRAIELQRQQAVLKAGALQDAIFNSAYFSSIATDEKGVIQIFNVGAERMLGYAAEDVLNRITPAELSDPDELIVRAQELTDELDRPITPGFDALVFKAARGIEDIYELTLVRKDGSRFPAIVSVTALRDAADHVIGYLLIGTDNTARKQVEAAQALLDAQLLAERLRFEQALQEKNVELEHASRMKSEFLATMSHELRTPLNAIIGFSEALKDGLMGPLEESQAEYIGDIFTSGQHLLSLINDILDLSKVEAGMMALEFEPVPLHDLLASTLSIVRERALTQRVRLVLDADEALGSPLLDLRKTKQVLYNLLSNAVKFSAAGDEVRLAARVVDRREVGLLPGTWPVHAFPLAGSEHRRFVELVVGDEGIGISEDSMAHLFQAFRQVDSSLARRFEGTGLGLAMVRKLAELHGGTVAVASAEGVGTRFAVWLPLRTETPVAAPPAGTPAAPHHAAAPGVQRMALVVEDDDRAAELVRLLLAAEGFAVVRAPDAEVALQVAARQVPSLIALDLQLPGIDGLEFLSRVRASALLAQVPVVIISGSAEGRLAAGANASADAVLKKPISRVELRESLARLGLLPTREQMRTVLVVDRDPKAVEVVAALLPAPDYSVVRAYDGREALALARRLHPDLLLLDLAMPGFNGFEILAALRTEAATATIPALVVTSMQLTAAEQAVLKAIPGRPVKVLAKSGFTHAAFVDAVARALQPE